MLSGLSKAFRVKAAIALALAYVACIMAAPAAFAFSALPNVAHCLTEGHVQGHVVAAVPHDHGHGTTVHVHADGTTHQHHDNQAAPKTSSDGKGQVDKGQVANCCGLFSTVAISAELGFAPAFERRASVVLPGLCDALNGRSPERINRPPIALLSL